MFDEQTTLWEEIRFLVYMGFAVLSVSCGILALALA